MKRTVIYTLTEEQATCVGDIRTAKRDLETMASTILYDKEIPPSYADFMYGVAQTLSFALKKLELE